MGKGKVLLVSEIKPIILSDVICATSLKSSEPIYLFATSYLKTKTSLEESDQLQYSNPKPKAKNSWLVGFIGSFDIVISLPWFSFGSDDMVSSDYNSFVNNYSFI